VRAILFASLLLFLGSVLPGQDVPANPRYVFEPLPARFRLTTATITSLAQDGAGFLWLGTQQGVLRYDGGRIERYGRQEGLPALFIDQLIAGPDGVLWVGTGSGIARFDGSRFQPVPLPWPGARTDHAYQIVAPDRSGAAFVATREGLARVDLSYGGAFRFWGTADGLPSKQVDAVHNGSDGNLYFLSGNQAMRLAPSNGRPEPLAPPLPEDPGLRKVAILRDAGGTIWVRTELRMYRLDPGQPAFKAEESGIPPANDFGIPALDREGDILLPTVDGLLLHRGGVWRRVGQQQGLESNAVFSAIEDREGSLWIGFGGSGVVRWSGSRVWSGWSKAEGLPDSVVWCVRRDGTGRLWVGTGQGLAMWDPRAGAWRTWSTKDGLAGPTVREIVMAPDGGVWTVSVPGGTSRIDPRTLRAKAVPGPPGKGSASGIALAPDGRIWVGNPSGLRILKHLDGSPVYDEVALPSSVAGMTAHPAFAPDGTLWSCGRNGISRFDGHRWSTFTEKEGLRSNMVPAVVPLSRDEIWFRYVEPFGLGRLRMRGQKPLIDHVTTANGLYSDSAFLLGLDREGHIWAGGNEGLNQVGADGAITGFTRADGLLWDDLSAGSFWQDVDGSIYVGTSRGLARLDARRSSPVRRNAAVLITAARLGSWDPLTQQNPSVEYVNATLGVQFTSLSFRDPDSIRCRYQLHGLERSYTETNQREARYVSIPPGSYRFEVSCRTPEGSWGRPSSFRFSVQPPWWGEWWARLLGSGFLAWIVILAIRWRTRSLDQERHRLERAVADRSAELARANQELKEAALTDPLTGIRNRRYFQVTIETDIQRVLRCHSGNSTRPEDLLFYLVDLDYFKRVNDIYGHESGDQVLVEAAARLSAVVRQSDTLVRWGGEEFLLVARTAYREEGAAIAQRILNAIGNESFELSSGVRLQCTCSVGWVAFPYEPKTAEGAVQTIMQLVDQALYLAKAEGRNRAIGVTPSNPTKEMRAFARVQGPHVKHSDAVNTAG
jgi:diguanylate cyclase (GGDEF)-like protein